jgi:hypothetical protein
VSCGGPISATFDDKSVYLPSSQGLGQFLQSANDTGTPAASSAACVCSGSSVGLRRTAASRFRRFIVSGGELERGACQHSTPSREHKIVYCTRIIGPEHTNLQVRASASSSSPFRNKRCNDIEHIRIMSSPSRRPRRSSHEPIDYRPPSPPRLLLLVNHHLSSLVRINLVYHFCQPAMRRVTPRPS